MRNLIIVIIMMTLGFVPMQAQQAKSTNKTFVVKSTKSESRDSITGVTITLKDRKTYPVYKGSRGGLYVWRTASKGQNVGKRIRVSLSSCMTKEEYAELKKMCGVK